MKRMAMFHPTEPPEGMTVNGRRSYKAFFAELNRLGYFEGRNFILERYSGLGQVDQYATIARKIVAGSPDVIISFGPVVHFLKAETTTIPIVTTSSDPVASGLVTNLAKPERNITGATVDAGLELYGKRLELLKQIVPTLANARYLTPASSITLSETVVGRLRAATGLANAVIATQVLDKHGGQAAYEQAFDAMEKDHADGLVVADNAEHLSHLQLIVDLAAKHRLPAVYPYREFADLGGLFSYGVDITDLMRRLADMTDQLLRGKKPGEIPFYQPTKFELVLSRKTASLLGMEFPTPMLAIADDVIE
jgi:putative ABC transport system substrate-binding protein